MEKILYKNNFDIISVTKECERANHFQQVVYSVQGECMTQVCFTCDKVRTTYDKPQSDEEKI